MNAGSCIAGGAGILIAGYLKQDFGLSGMFAGVSAISLVHIGNPPARLGDSRSLTFAG